MMWSKLSKYRILALITFGIVAVFVIRTLLAANYEMPRLFDLFALITFIGALIVVMSKGRNLRFGDWVTSAALGLLIGYGMRSATLFSPYPFLGVVRGNLGQAWIRGSLTYVAALGGLVIYRMGGPVPLHTANGSWKKAASDLSLGLVIGLPLAVLNIFALKLTQATSINWQNPVTAALDALQPGVVEEVVYRFALWGLIWLVLRPSLGEQAAWNSGLLASLVHNFAHFDDLWIEAPLVALGMGLVMGVLWGLPPYLLARKKGLESAISFHWLQDAARFFAGF